MRKTGCCRVYLLSHLKIVFFYLCFSCSLPFFFVGSIYKYVFPKPAIWKNLIWGRAQSQVLSWQEFSVWAKFECEHLTFLPGGGLSAWGPHSACCLCNREPNQAPGCSHAGRKRPQPRELPHRRLRRAFCSVLHLSTCPPAHPPPPPRFQQPFKSYLSRLLLFLWKFIFP